MPPNFETQILLNLNELEFDTSEELTVESIKSHYKKLSLYYHPDHNNNEIFRDKQKKINGARDFLMQNIDEVNRYIRRVNYKETAEDKARREKEEWERAERERRAYYEQEAKKKQESAKAEAAKAKAEAEKAKAEAEKAHAEQRARNAAREAEEAKARAAEAEQRARMAENAKREAESKKRTVRTVILAIIIILIGIPLTVGCIMAGVKGFNEGMAADSESVALADKESRTRQITDTNLPKTFIKGVNVNWADYYVTYKDENGNDVKIVLSDGMMTINYDTLDEQSAEISIDNGKVYLYHKLTVTDSTPISSVQELKDIASKPAGTYILNADIDLGGSEWTPIASFEGTLIGNGHSIKNLTITSFTTKNVGLFDTVTEKAVISDLKLENVSIISASSAESVGALAGLLGGSLKNVSVSGKVEAAGSNAVGGIAGAPISLGTKIINSSFDGSVIGSNGVGGIIGGNDESTDTLIDNCTASGSVSGTTAVGGIAGSLSYPSNGQKFEITNCKNLATVNAKVEYCGGIVGKLINTTSWGPPVTSITGCTNEGTVSGGNYTGGIVGYMHIGGGYSYAGTVNNNSNKANVTGKNYTGGIIGFNDFETAITASENSGAIKGEAYVGGFVGYGNYTTLSGLTNEQSVEGSFYVGGVAGLVKSCTDCHNKGAISATLYDTENTRTGVGGVCGLVNEATNCTNSGNITSTSGYGVGGVIGANANSNYDGKYSNLKNSGSITVNGGMSNGVGGIIGSFACSGSRSTPLNISGCENTGSITASAGSAVGGIVGYTKTTDKITIISCTVNAAINASECSAVGGIVGLNANSKGQAAAKIETVTVNGSIIGKSSVGSVIGLTAREPNNYESIKVTYTVSSDISLNHIGKIA